MFKILNIDLKPNPALHFSKALSLIYLPPCSLQCSLFANVPLQTCGVIMQLLDSYGQQTTHTWTLFTKHGEHSRLHWILFWGYQSKGGGIGFQIFREWC